MNIKDFILPFLLTFSFTLLLKHWLQPSAPQEQTEFVAPQAASQLEPLYTDIIFDLTMPAESSKEVTINTSYGEFSFTSEGALLSKVVLYHGADKRPFTVVDQTAQQGPHYGNFLVALDEKTPWTYAMSDVQEQDMAYSVSFTAQTNECSIKKTYVIDKERNRIDIELALTPNKNNIVRPRVMWVCPFQQGGSYAQDSQQLFRIDSKGNFKKYPIKSLNEQLGFFGPLFFGTDSKYFTASFFQDGNKAIKRAYSHVVNGDLYAIIEGKEVTESTVLRYSFCMIPKDTTVLYDAIKPLEKTFDYGFFGFFTKMMIVCLEFVNKLIGNYGWAIILITFLLKLVLMPWTYRSMAKMKEIKEKEKRFAYMQQKVAHDPVALARLREEHVKENMGSMLGAQVPLLIQMPFVFGLMGVINNSLELCGTPFILWMNDLSMPDKYHVLPILFGLIFFLNVITSQNITFRKFVAYAALTLFIVGWFMYFSVALMLFILVTMIFHIAQNMLAQKA